MFFAAPLAKTMKEKDIHQKEREKETSLKHHCTCTSLVAQWIRICLPMQGTRVRSLVWEDPTCQGTTKPASLNS